MIASPLACHVVVAIASLSAALAVDPVAVEIKLSVFDESRPVAAQLQALGEPYATALKKTEAPMQAFLTAYAVTLQQGLDKAKASGDLGRVKIHEIALANWKLGKLPTGGTGLAGEMQFIMKSPKVFAPAWKNYTAIAKRLADEGKAHEAKALSDRVQEIGKDFGTLPGSPLYTSEILTYIFPVNGDFAHRLGAARELNGRMPSIQDTFRTRGVDFPAGASAVVSADGKLIARNTRENLYLIQQIVASL
ncbi:MAG: hypothetical protein EOP83_13665 [Verrucomicrobiaceae bacterium]|nr:MAG: hypothetical protein EOP83_13665 [Verrucomicrobiaceae bacterium]